MQNKVSNQTNSSKLLVRRRVRLAIVKLTLSINNDILADFRMKFPDVNISASVEAFFEDCIKNGKAKN